MSTEDEDKQAGQGQSDEKALARSRAIAWTVAAAFFMTGLDGAVLVTAIPQMARSFDVPPVNMSLAVVVYLVFQAAFLPACGWAADRAGAKSLFAGAIVVFILASVACAFSTGFWPFIAFRAVQGLAASFMVPVGRIVLLHSTRKRDLIGAMNISTTAGLIAPAVGPPLGGLIVTYGSWPWIFLLNVPIGALGLFCVWRFIPNLKGRSDKPFDALGFLLTASAVTCLLLGLEAGGHGGRSQGAMALLPVGVVLAVLAVRHALRTPHPLVPLSPVRFQTFVVANLTAAALVRTTGRAAPFVYPLMFQVVFGMSPLASGMMLLALIGGDLGIKPLTRPALKRWGFRTVLLVSAIATAIMIGATAAFFPGLSPVVIFVVLALCGIARSFLLTGFSALSVADVPREEFSASTTLTNLMLQLGAAVGVSGAAFVLSTSASLRGHPDMLDLFDCRLVLLLMAALTLAAVFSIRRLPPDAGAAISGHGR